MNKQPEYFHDLIISYLTGEASSEQVFELADWLKQSPDHEAIFNDLRQTWLLIEAENIEQNVNIDLEWEKIKGQMSSGTKIIELKPEIKPAKKRIGRLISIAAVIIVLVVTSIVLNRVLQEPQQKVLHADIEQFNGTLPDGTIITLNNGSEVTFPEKFTGDERFIKLDGEAYFDVVSDKEHPFIINTGGVYVEVVGTSFYVNTRGEENTVEVIVTSGKVAVYDKDNRHDKVLLEAGEKASVSRDRKVIARSVNDDQNFLAWKTMVIVFENKRLSEIVKTLNKVYHSDIRLMNPELGNCNVTATFDHQSLDAILNVLKATLDLEIIKKGKVIEIDGKTCNQ